MDAELKTALNIALLPACDAATARGVFAALEHGSPDLGHLQYRIGRDNFTYFIFSLYEDDPLNQGQYEWKLELSGITPLATYLNRHLTAIAWSDISEFRWERKNNGTIEGEFHAETPYGLQAIFLFVAKETNRQSVITKLVVKNKASSNVDDGYVILERHQDDA